ncbi:MAG: ATP-binding cassette domain-containing protein [Myxococcota bacterium]|nr:ATP-binding cassette domain-containing protein [Myxococcota bacterium]
MTLFELRQVTKRYGTRVALQPTDLTIHSGETLVLIGPSGSGKSTVIRLLLGLEPVDGGALLYRGAALLPQTAAALRRQVGYVAQGGGLFPHLTAAQNVALMARQLGWSQPRIEQRLGELATLTRLPGDVLPRYPAQLSGGQAQRLSLMRALMLDPEVVVLDEPLGALDPITRYELQQDLRDVFQRLNKTVVMVTHDLTEAAWFAGRMVLLREGRIVQQGSLEDFRQRPAEPFVTRFLHAQRSPA